MAQRIETRLLDDLALERGEGEVEAAGTFLFGQDGKTYEIDLTAENAQALSDALAPFVTAARPVKRAAATPSVTRKSSKPKDPAQQTRMQAAREWLRDVKGYDVKERGRIKPEWLAEYDAAHPQSTDPAASTAEVAAVEPAPAPAEAPEAPVPAVPAWG